MIVLSAIACTEAPPLPVPQRAGKDRTEKGSAGFRSLVGESIHELTEKYRPAATILGCVRLVITASGPGALRLTDEDLAVEGDPATWIRGAARRQGLPLSILLAIVGATP